MKPHFQKKKAQKPELIFTVKEEDVALPFLLKSLTKLSRNSVKSLLSGKEVELDGKIITRHDHPLKPGQTLRILPKAKKGEPPKNLFPILYEDEELLVINKPAGLLSIATEKEKEQTAYHMAMEHIKLSHPHGRIYIVHRLDRETSGVLLFAKSESMKKQLQENWNDLIELRSYVAVLEGIPEPKAGRIHTWLKETKTLLMYSSKEKGDGQEAITDYEVIKTSEHYALAKIKLQTGRKNQIRVHMKELGTPVTGDSKYGAKHNPMKRLGLHADKLELIHPITGQLLSFYAQPPNSFNGVIKTNGVKKIT